MTSKPMEGETVGRSLGVALKAAQAVSGVQVREPGPGFSMELREPVVSMRREPFKWRPHKNLSTDARH